MSACELGEVLQQCGFRLGLAILQHRNHREWDIEWPHERFEIGVIADDADDVAVEFADVMAAQQVDHAVRQPRDHDDESIALGGVE